MDKNQLEEHLRFAKELGVAGVSRDPVWRERAPADVKTAPIEAPPAEVRPVTIALTPVEALDRREGNRHRPHLGARCGGRPQRGRSGFH